MLQGGIGTMPSSRLTFNTLLGFCVLGHVLNIGVVAGFRISCCKEVFTDGSTAYRLNHAPGPNCSNNWSINDKVVVDEAAGVDWDTVQFVGQKLLLLYRNISGIVYQLECPHSGVSQNVLCTDPCISHGDASPGPQAAAPITPKRFLLLFVIFSIFGFIIVILLLIIICTKKHHRCYRMKYSPPAQEAVA